MAFVCCVCVMWVCPSGAAVWSGLRQCGRHYVGRSRVELLHTLVCVYLRSERRLVRDTNIEHSPAMLFSVENQRCAARCRSLEDHS